MRKAQTVVFALLLGITPGWIGCSSCSDETSQDEEGDVEISGDVDPGTIDDAGGDEREDVGEVEDAADLDASDPDADDRDAVDLDAAESDSDDPDAAAPDAGEEACPFPYQLQCGGECVAVNSNPDHCGDCEVECEGEEACVGGECTTDCLGDLELCDNECVDLNINNDHCGTCGNDCDDGEGCVEDGQCLDSTHFGPAPEKCADGGPPIDVGFGAETDESECAGSISESTFLWAVCSCGDLEHQDDFLSDGFNSSSGAYQPGGLGGGVGVNGDLIFQSYTEIWGALYVGDGGEALFEDEIDIHQQLHAGGNVEVQDDGWVGDDAYVTGDIDASGGLEVTGTLYQDPAGGTSGDITTGDSVEQSVYVHPPCNCDPEEAIPIGDIVDAAALDNDNEEIGLDEDLFAGGDAPRRVDLPCGNYYLSEIDADDEIVIATEGRTALYIGGDVHVRDNATLTPDPTGELDIFVAGDFHAEDELTLGSPNYPASTRLYVGGDDGLLIESMVDIGGNIYVVPGAIELQDEMEIFGALYGQEVLFEDNVAIHYDRQVARSGAFCPEPEEEEDEENGSGGGDADAGFDDTGEDAGEDAGNGEEDGGACVLEDEPCQEDTDCCAPLICDEQTQTCALMSCLAPGEDCVANDECCSGVCSAGGEQEGECIVQ